MNWSQIENKMKRLWGYIKKLLNVLYKQGAASLMPGSCSP